MRIETFKINTLYRGIALEGNCMIIPCSTYSVTMEKPYKGLSKSAYLHIPVDTRSAFPVISVQSPVSIQYRWQS